MTGMEQTRTSQRPSRESIAVSSTYMLFQRRRTPDLYCAVPEDHPLPGFLSTGEWEGVGRVAEAQPTPPGFRVHQARSGMRLNGFYLFMAGASASRSTWAAEWAEGRFGVRGRLGSPC